MESSFRRTVLAGLLALLAPIRTVADQPGRAYDSQLIIEEFDVAGDGDVLIVPLQIAGKVFAVQVDTGFSLTTLDKKLEPLLGKPKGTRRVQALNGHRDANIFDQPALQLGTSIRLQPGEVATLDLTMVRQVIGHEVCGILGMPALRPNVVRIDFDRGKLLFLRSTGDDPGVPVAMVYDRVGRPQVDVNVTNWGPEPFDIDTGCIGQHSGSLETRLFQRLERNAVLRILRPSFVVDAAGNSQIRSGAVDGLSIGGFARSNLEFDEHAAISSNLLGLGFLSRFIVTFDFPRNVLYLKPSRHFDRPDLGDLSGIHFLRRDGALIIEKVDRYGPADTAGILAKDILMAVDGAEVSKARLFPIRRLLSTPGETVALTVQRGDGRFEVSLDLPKSPLGEVVAGARSGE